jgi:cytochrome c oxidase subunit 2
MQKKFAYFITATALVLALSACGGGGNNGKVSEASPSVSASAAQEIIIKAESWKYDQQEYVIPKDTPIKLTLENLNGAHGVEIEGTDYTLRGNKSTIITLAAGTYEIKCNIMCGKGHSEMKAKLVVS